MRPFEIDGFTEQRTRLRLFSILALLLLIGSNPNECFALELDRSCSQPPYPTAPLVAFSMRLSGGPSFYTVPPFYCNFGTDAVPYMHFEKHLSPTYFYDQRDLVGFGCTEKMKDGSTRFVVPNITIFKTVFAATSIRFEDCKYAAVPAESSTVQTTKSSSNVANRDDASFNLQDNERRLITGALQKSNGDTAEAAKKLGISERALLRKMKEYNIK